MKLAQLRFVALLSVLLVCLTAPSLALSEIYRWVDENGVVHYSEVPPPSDQDAETHDLPATPEEVTEIPSAGIDFDGEGAVESDAGAAADMRRQQLAESREQRRAEQAELARVCDQAMARLEKIEPNRRVYFTNEEGETERMDDEERASEVSTLRAFLEANCP